MIKRIVLVSLCVLAVIAIIIFVYRYKIIQYSAETLIRKYLPGYVRIKSIKFDSNASTITLEKFGILNPPGFSERYLLQISSVRCGYRLKGANILDGLELYNPVLKELDINIERLKDGRVNLIEMGKVLDSSPGPSRAENVVSAGSGAAQKLIGNKAVSDIMKLPQSFALEGGKAVFIDRLPYSKPHVIIFDIIKANLGLKLNEPYSKVLWVDSDGEGYMNGRADETISWIVALNPTTPDLTMSNRLEVSGLEILPFEPYYDKHSPFVVKKGKFSGTLVFDFDNGNIGSTNELHLRDFVFEIKPDHENIQFLEYPVRDVAKYFTSPFGEIVFDFKLKGPMSNIRPLPGPITKQALISMAVSKAMDVISKAGGEQGSGSGDDIKKAKEYIELFKGMLKK